MIKLIFTLYVLLLIFCESVCLHNNFRVLLIYLASLPHRYGAMATNVIMASTC